MLIRNPRKVRWSESEKSRARKRRRQHRVFATAVLAAVASLVVTQPAWADGGSPEDEGYVMVQQAISYLVNEPGPTGTAEALDRVGNALAADDQDGVDILLLEQAQADLEAGKPDDARPLLQDSISEAVASLSLATGEETGTTTVLPPLQGNGLISGMDLILLVLSVVAAVGGAGLAYLFRPRENLRALSEDIRAGGEHNAH